MTHELPNVSFRGCIHSTSKAQLLPFGNVQVAAAAAPVAPDTTKQQSHAGLIALAGTKKMQLEDAVGLDRQK